MKNIWKDKHDDMALKKAIAESVYVVVRVDDKRKDILKTGTFDDCLTETNTLYKNYPLRLYVVRTLDKYMESERTGELL